MTAQRDRWRKTLQGFMVPIGVAVLAAGFGLMLTVTTGATSSKDSYGVTDSLTRGKKIYFTRCAQCHSALPVTKYSYEDWERFLPLMIRKSKLDTTQESDLRAYVRASRLMSK